MRNVGGQKFSLIKGSNMKSGNVLYVVLFMMKPLVCRGMVFLQEQHGQTCQPIGFVPIVA
jgi:hypothetical protein